MATDVYMPKLGITMEEGTIIRWLKHEGEPVQKGEPLLEIETDKISYEVEAPGSGILRRLLAGEGQKVEVGKTIGVIGAPEEDVSRYQALGPGPVAPAAAPASAGARPPSAGPSRSAPSAVQEAAAPPTEGGWVKASPIARRLAREHRVNLARVRGTGPGGRILERDILSHVKATAGAPARPAPGVAPRVRRVVPLTAMRRVVAERMAQSKREAPHFYVARDVDMTEVIKVRLEMEARGRAPTYTDFIILACARALDEYADVNASFGPEGITLYEDANIGIAVAVEGGLVVPVLREANRLSLYEIASASRELVERARQRRLMPDDYAGGTFTISNLGMFNVDGFSAIINPPDSAILAVGGIVKR
ncbi:MAG: 2-oxo acid dehydrogenase subunit E2, partial [Deltaproteobacteria bacterium]|nr:2-oxo acid dehydrogenase subunit E2 [Deltaproteobacteria bacterium]